MTETPLPPLLERIATALERLVPPPRPGANLADGDAFVWHAESGRLQAVPAVSGVSLGLLRGIDAQAAKLLANTRHLAQGFAANNALLWGARGTGKSALVKAVHARVNTEFPHTLALIEIHREDIASLPALLAQVRDHPRRCILFCDDLSFDRRDTQSKSLKSVLEGGIEGRPEGVVFYATSNRRHLMPREMIENEQSTAINPGEAVEETVSLSDRFGLWLGFHSIDQQTYLEIITGYVNHFGLDINAATLRAEAIGWAQTRGSRSGRVAWQFIQDLAGRLGQRLDPAP